MSSLLGADMCCARQDDLCEHADEHEGGSHYPLPHQLLQPHCWALIFAVPGRTTSVSTLMYVKEDLIIPHHISFYDLISTKARGKSGPLFHFDVHEDIRTQSDARIEKDESHAGTRAARH